MNVLNNLGHIPKIGLSDCIEIIIIAVALYSIVNKLKDTRAWILIKGILILIGLYGIAYLCKFEVIVILFKYMLSFIAITLVLVLQPEIRRFIERVGINNLNTSITKILSLIKRAGESDSEKLLSDKDIQELVKGCSIMSKAKTGALIVIENEIPLTECIETGIKVDAVISSQLLINIFEHNTPLHDGAVIIRNGRIVSATCYLPLTDNNSINKDLGTRHRAAIGMSENSDALVIVVSEETGAMSIALDSVLYHNLDREGLTEGLQQIQNKTKINIDSLEKLKETIESKTIKKGFKHSLSNLLCLFGIDKGRDFLMRICVLGVTLVMWLGVTSTVNPVITKTIANVPVQLYNIESIEEINKTYEVQKGKTVDILVRGRKLDVDKINQSNIEAKANMENLSITNSIPIEARVNSTYTGVNSLSVELIPKSTNVIVAIEDIVTTELPLEINIDKEPSREYYIKNIQTDKESIIISGATSLVSKIGNVKLNIDASDIKEDTTMELVPIVYDKNGEVMDTSKLELSIDKVETDICLFETKKVQFSVDVLISNEDVRKAAESVSCDIVEIYIAGSEETLDKLDKVIAAVQLDISLKDITSNKYIKVINISDYLPDGVYLANKTDRAEIKVVFTGIKNTTFSISNELLEIRGLSGEMVGSVITSAKARGIEQQEKSDKQDIKATIVHYESADNKPKFYVDASGLGVGEHEVDVHIEGLTPESEVYAYPKVRISITE